MSYPTLPLSRDGVSPGEEVPRDTIGSDESCSGHSLLCSLNLKEKPQGHFTQSPASKPLKAGTSVCQISRKGDCPASLEHPRLLILTLQLSLASLQQERRAVNGKSVPVAGWTQRQCKNQEAL
ncbi:hypothetical protein mRhiFer1_008959 [Rhinolophus ferrumequinum]|uniref:Uncharacterized protein n=1 Tax=Rhinolophus ferrumequinum TaxID=59479 RepID=A0A7J7TDV2_RHIFE|nr:hypothetical protein mRhiFer1_008959 [Rhinolophus ferrumequinum]